MNRLVALFKLFFRMFAYGCLLGGITGSLVLLTTGAFTDIITEGRTGIFILADIVGNALFAVTLGGLFGILFGGFAGFYSGIIMTVVTAVGFREIRKPRFYKLSMGFITFIVSGYILFAAGMFCLVYKIAPLP